MIKKIFVIFFLQKHENLLFNRKQVPSLKNCMTNNKTGFYKTKICFKKVL